MWWVLVVVVVLGLAALVSYRIHRRSAGGGSFDNRLRDAAGRNSSGEGRGFTQQGGM